MPLLIAVGVLVAGLVVGAGKNEGVFRREANTTYIDTVRFEKAAALRTEQRARMEAERIKEKEKNYAVGEREKTNRAAL